MRQSVIRIKCLYLDLSLFLNHLICFWCSFFAVKLFHVSNVHTMQEKVNCSFSSGGSNLHSAQTIITSPLLLSSSPLVYRRTLYSKHGPLWIATPSAYVHVMRVIVPLISFSSAISGHLWSFPNAEIKLANFDSAPCRHAAIYSRWPFSVSPPVRHLNYKRGLGLWLMMEPGGDCEHVFGCGLFPVNQIMEPCRAAQMWGMSAKK